MFSSNLLHGYVNNGIPKLLMIFFLHYFVCLFSSILSLRHICGYVMFRAANVAPIVY
jgi:hypothetical protein